MKPVYPKTLANILRRDHTETRDIRLRPPDREWSTCTVADTVSLFLTVGGIAGIYAAILGWIAKNGGLPWPS